MSAAIFLGATPLLSSEPRTLPGPAAVPDRAVLRCPGCRLVQYATKTNRCRRCYARMVLPAPPPPPPPAPAPGRPNVAGGVRHWRRLRGLTQKQLATCSQLPRTYISRIENGRIVPGLVTLERVAGALNIALPALLLASGPNGGPANGKGSGNGGSDPGGQNSQNGSAGRSSVRIPAPVSDVDACLRELLRYSGVLTGAQRQQVLMRVRAMVPAHLVMSH